MTSPDPAVPAFQRLQYDFCAYLRDPEHVPPPAGLDPRRADVYRELIFNNIEGLLASNFPVIRGITSDADWERLVREFLIEHQAHTPLFPEIGREMLRYLEARAERGADDPPYFVELAHYEYAELVVGNDEAVLEEIPHDVDGDLLASAPVLSPVAWPLAYRFPVHRISVDFQPEEPPAEPTCLIVVRQRDDRVAFIEATPATLRLLAILKENPGRTGLEIVNALADLFDPGERDAAIAAGTQMLRDLADRDVILGTLPTR